MRRAALYLLPLVVAAALRLWMLGDAPPGLYRDEAFNGLDAVGVLNGEHALFFTANNGREPAYVYLTALSVAFLGRTALAVRLAAALSGVVTTALSYGLARAWFGRTAGYFAAWLWAVTLWPVHLSRIGLRPILLAPLLALALWMGTRAYRRGGAGLWLAAGMVYGATFYTYLAARFTPLFLAPLLSYMLLTRPAAARRRLWRGLLWGALGTGVMLLPWGWLAWQQPDLLLGRAQQVSILNPAVNGGSVLGTLLRQTGQAAGMFLWQGDTIARHNPPGRPVFDVFMAVPFIVGLLWCLRHWRRPAALALLLWLAVMMGPTILAEDTPHFLRAAGLLPAATILPALGLSKMWDWPKLTGALRWSAVLVLALASLTITVSDYTHYVRQPRTSYLFEAAARTLAQQVEATAEETDVHLDRRYWEGWPSVPFLVTSEQRVHLFSGQPDAPALPLSLFAWPYGPLEFVPRLASPPAVVTVETGPLARGDLEPEAYPLYVRYGMKAYVMPAAPAAWFGNQVALLEATATMPDPGHYQIDLWWRREDAVEAPLVTFIHIVSGNEIVGQYDGLLAQGYWPVAAWRPGQVIHERQLIAVDAVGPPAEKQILVGLYDAATQERLPVFAGSEPQQGDVYRVVNETHEE